MKNIIIDCRMRACEKEFLRDLGYQLIEIPKSDEVYPEISSHVDIFVCKIKNSIFVEKTIFDNILCKIEPLNGTYQIGGKIGRNYPEDVKYNVCQIGDKVAHNFKYTDSKILEFIEKEKLQKIQISQGYANCSIAVINENAVIVEDKKMAEILRKYNIDVLCLDDLPDIKLLNAENQYSQMKGFIGGAMARVEDKIIVFGDLNKIDKHNKIATFIKSHGLEIVDFEGLDVIDYGGIVVV